MKDISKANRGRQFEDWINLASARYERDGIAVIHKVPTEFLPLRGRDGRVAGAKVTHKSCVDYLGRYMDMPVAIEAKHTNSARLEYSAVQPHQAAFLDEWTIAAGAIGMVLISFQMSRFFAVPWSFWRTPRLAWEQGEKIKIGNDIYGWKWRSNGMASVSAEELLPEWEIKPHDGYAFPYLDIAERIRRERNTDGKEPQEMGI